jgi:membrane protein DedA with SNARE-associated domain
MPFLIFNAAGGILWATLYGLAGYFLGHAVLQIAGTVGKVAAGLAVLIVVLFVVVLGRHERRWEEEADRALPGPLDEALLARGTRR